MMVNKATFVGFGGGAIAPIHSLDPPLFQTFMHEINMCSEQTSVKKLKLLRQSRTNQQHEETTQPLIVAQYTEHCQSKTRDWLMFA